MSMIDFAAFVLVLVGGVLAVSGGLKVSTLVPDNISKGIVAMTMGVTFMVAGVIAVPTPEATPVVGVPCTEGSIYGEDGA